MAETSTRNLAYLELLNTICSQEGRAGVYLKTWADKAQDPSLKHCLALVAERETSHYHIFKRRITELGFELAETGDPDAAERLRIVGSDIADSEKIKSLQEIRKRQPEPSIRERYEAAMEDPKVDPLTRSLLRWFADVEADSQDLMAEAYEETHRRARGDPSTDSG